LKPEDTERRLLEGLAVRDYTAANVIYRENYGMVQSFVLQNNGSYDDARDVFQETMIVLFEKSKDPNFSLTCQIRTFVYSVSRRIWLKRLQQSHRFGAPVELLEDAVAVDDEIAEKEQIDRDFLTMDAALKNIGEPCKSLLEAYYIQKRTMLEIAETFGYTNADNAKNQKYKCLIRLKKLFFAQYKQAD
jgi:RNA polymerase sigma factor (sigma-70 family)